MTDRHEALERLRSVNPVAGVALLDPGEVVSVVTLCEERRLTPDVEHRQRPAPGARRSVWRPALVFVAAFAAIIVAVGIFGLLGRDGQPVIGEPTPIMTTIPTVATTLPPVLPEAVPIQVGDTAIGERGSFWVATDHGVVNWLHGADEPFVYTTDDGLPSDAVFRVVVSPDGEVWVGGDGWMSRFDVLSGPRWVSLTAADSLGPMAIGPNGDVWSIAGTDRLLRFDGSDWETIVVPGLVGDDGEWSDSLAIAPDGTIWAGTNLRRGVVEYDGSSFTHHGPATGLPDGFGSTVAVAPDGTVWVGSEAFGYKGFGVASFDGSGWTVYTTNEGLLSDTGSVVVGADGTVWAVHNGPRVPGGPDVPGVSRFDGTSWSSFPGVSGAGDRATVDDDGVLWMPTADPVGVMGFDGSAVALRALPSVMMQSNATIDPPPGYWDPILTETRPKTAPPAAVCSPGMDQNAPGPIGQNRPMPGEYSSQAAVFDRVWGRIVMIDSYNATWTFDVCTNTWHEMKAAGVPAPGGNSLIYDVDSDRTVLFGQSLVWIYDRDQNAWDPRLAYESEGGSWFGLVAFYDPASGLIVSIGEPTEDNAGRLFSAYDVDTDEWTAIGFTDPGRDSILGYSRDADRIIAMDAFSEFGTDLIDPRTGVTTHVERDHPTLVGAFGSVQLANGANTAYALSWGPGDQEVCGFDAEILDWTCIPHEPNGVAITDDEANRPYDAITYDRINERLVFIGGEHLPIGPGEIVHFDDVWSLDPETGEWFELVRPSNDGS